MNFKAKISGLDKPNLNGRVYSKEVLENLLKDPLLKEMNNNWAIPVYSYPPLDEVLIPSEEKERIGTAHIDSYKDDILNLDVNIRDDFIEKIQNKYIVPFGYVEYGDVIKEEIEGNELDLIHNFTLNGFFLSDTTALKGEENNCKLIPDERC